MNRRHCLMSAGLTLLLPRAVLAHHGWSSFDQNRPIWLEGKAAKVAWRNPHVELELALDPELKLPADLASRPLPAQSAGVDGARLLAAATLPMRRDRLWQIELAPLTRMQAWKVEEIKPGTPLGLLGFTFSGEKGDAVLRVEYLFVAGKTYGLRSSPA
ncbi:DUF6152 family protein [Roseateles toxinivorans]|uniref:Uncharacterized protein n=1 Tax=Roseateles toxinivorans TaxID=270368 RepID=A0A4R6QMG6_9BURK|nr:DUF6152 family protein [Roseateles toxinivorans]TDP71310.1 hypothetical protein DES47_103291 [Roseateles toxinivorans]